MTNCPTYKIILVGEGGCGKSAFARGFSPKYIATFGVEVFQVEKRNAIYNIWDCAGQEKFSGLGIEIFEDADLVICAFDLTCPRTLEKAKLLKRSISLAIETQCILVGMKSDIGTVKVPKNILKCSSKTGNGMKSVFSRLSELLA